MESRALRCGSRCGLASGGREEEADGGARGDEEAETRGDEGRAVDMSLSLSVWWRLQLIAGPMDDNSWTVFQVEQ